MNCTVDRIEGEYAVLETENEERLHVPLYRLPQGVREGSCVTLSEGVFYMNEAEAAARRNRTYRLQQSLKKMKKMIFKA